MRSVLSWPDLWISGFCLGLTALACTAETTTPPAGGPTTGTSATGDPIAGTGTGTTTSGVGEATATTGVSTVSTAGTSSTGGASNTGSTTSNTADVGAGGTGNTSTNTLTTGAASAGSCDFTVDSAISSAIGTVGIVDWTTTAAPTSAQIQFGPANAGLTLAAPVDVTEGPSYRTLLLGMKGEREYAFQIVLTTAGGSCSSELYTITTGPVANSVPTITRQVMNETAIAPGFIITSGGIGNLGGAGGGANVPVFIIDQDGDIVWWASAPNQTSRARMDWEGRNMWMLALNVGNNGGEMRRVSMDGLDVETNVAGLSSSHHDFTVLPGGIIASIPWSSNGSDVPSNLVERSPDGTITTIATLDASIYQSNTYHTNSILYHQADDTYTVGDRYPNLYVKLDRDGQVIWQFGGENPVGPFISGGSWQVNHGHHLLENGNILIFNNGNGGFGMGGGSGSSAAIEFRIDGTTANEVWRYTSSNSSPTLGDVQRLPNGNTLVTYSNAGVIHEVDASGSLVQSLSLGSLGYAQHRATLYGPPPR